MPRGSSQSTFATTRPLLMRKLALLVAVDSYDDPLITPLNYAGADAREIGRALKDRCDFDVVRSLDGGPSSRKATKGAVLDALVAMAAEARPEDLLLFYFSGHGVLTHYLLEGLAGPAWPEASPQLEFRHLAHYASREVRKWSDAMRYQVKPQQPWYQEVGSGDPIVIAFRNVTNLRFSSCLF